MMKKYFLLLILFGYGGVIPNCLAVDLSTVCHMMWDLGDNSNITLPESRSALSIYNSGAELEAPANIWCLVAPHSKTKGQWYVTLSASQTSDNALLNLQNVTIPDSTPLHFSVCGGKRKFDKICVANNHSSTTFNFSLDGDLIPHLLHYQSTSTDTCKGGVYGTHDCTFKRHQLMLLHLDIPAHQILKPGVYKAPVTVALKTKIMGVGIGAFDIYHNIVVTSDGSPDDDSQATLNFTVTVTDDCEINRVNDIDFGSKPFLSDFKQKVEALQVQCTDGTPYHITLTGQNKGTENSAFYMQGATHHQLIRYQMQFQKGSEIESGIPSTQMTGTGLVQEVPIDVSIPTDQSNSIPTPDSYKDIVTAVVTY